MKRSPGIIGRRLAMIAVFLAIPCATPLAAQRGMPEDIGGIPEQKEFKEDEVTLPPPPGEAGLIEFRPRGSSKNRFYMDASSVSLGQDWVVRYTLIVKSPSGVSNVSYEGMRCKTSEYKVYAFAARDGQWIKSREPKWQPTGVTNSNFHYSIWKDYLCDSEAVAGRNAKDLVIRLKGNDPYQSNTTNNN